MAVHVTDCVLRPTVALVGCRELYDVVLLSPRNYFLYTPLLPAVAAGSMEERSIVEPVRHLLHDKVSSTGGQAVYACGQCCLAACAFW